MVSLDISEAVSLLIEGDSAVARWWDDLIALESSAGSAQEPLAAPLNLILTS